MSTITATVAALRVLSAEDLRQAVRDALRVVPARARVLAVIPDRTRDDNTDLLFPMLSQELAARGASQFDALVAQGTHPPMSDADEAREDRRRPRRTCRSSARSSIITGIGRPS